MEQSEAAAANEGAHWLQRWIAIASTIGISKSQLLNDYYVDEFLIVLDEYNELQKINTDEQVEEVGAEEW